MPNPSDGRGLALAVRLSGPSRALKLALFSAAMTKLALWELEAPGGWRQGWSLATVPLPQRLAAGTYYVRVRCHGKGALARLVVLN